MMHSSYRHLLDRARKAGVTTGDLYRALSTRQPTRGDEPVGRADSNGYVAQVQTNGQREYQPGSAK